MTLTYILAAAATIVAAATALAVGYLQRKQMRQIELYRKDPTAGLAPPPSALWRFITSRGRLVLSITLPALIIGIEWVRAEPVTRWTVIVISLSVASFVLAVVLNLIERMFRTVSRLVDLQVTLAELQDRHLAVTEHFVDKVKRRDA